MSLVYITYVSCLYTVFPLGEPKPPVGGTQTPRWGTRPTPSGRTHYPRGKRRERCFTSQSAAGLLCQRGMSLRCTCGLPTSFLRNGTERALHRRFHRGLGPLLLVHSRQTSSLYKSHAFLLRRLYQMPRQTSTMTNPRICRGNQGNAKACPHIINQTYDSPSYYYNSYK